MSYVITEDDPTTLVHYGRLGMKWYQHIFGDDPRWGRSGRNSKGDGDGDHSNDGTPSTERPKKSGTSTRDLKKAVKRVDKLTDEQLDALIARLQKQKQFKELAKESMSTESRRTLAGILKKVGKESGTGIGYGTSAVTMQEISKALARANNSETKKFLSQVLSIGSDYVKSKTKKK